MQPSHLSLTLSPSLPAMKVQTLAEQACSNVALIKACQCRMLFSLKALLFGEDFTSDPVSKAIAFCLRSFSRGHLVRNLQMFSQVSLTLDTVEAEDDPLASHHTAHVKTLLKQ